ncbi:hypothetical protein YC2023_115283 [Brassica napus]
MGCVLTIRFVGSNRGVFLNICSYISKRLSRETMKEQKLRKKCCFGIRQEFLLMENMPYLHIKPAALVKINDNKPGTSIYKFKVYILGAWRRLICAKQVISLAETMKSICSPRRLPDKSSGCRRLTWKSSSQCRDDFHRSRLRARIDRYTRHGVDRQRSTQEAHLVTANLKPKISLSYKIALTTWTPLDIEENSIRRLPESLQNISSSTLYFRRLWKTYRKSSRKSSWKYSSALYFRKLLRRLPISLSKPAPDLKNLYIKPRFEKPSYQKMFK